MRNDARESADVFFKNVLRLKINNDGLRFSELEKFNTFPRVASNPGISMDRLFDLAGTQTHEGGTVDIIVYHVINSVETLRREGLVRESDGCVFPTEKGQQLFAFFKNADAVEGWLRSAAAKAQAVDANMFRFEQNADKVLKTISRMIDISREGLSATKRE